MKRLATSALVVLTACGGGTDDPGPATPGARPPSGFYALTITTTADTCTPPRIGGDRGTLLVSTKEAAGANIPLPFTDGAPPRQDVPWAGTSMNDFAGCAGSKVDIGVARTSSDGFEVEVTEQWRGVSACAGAPSLLGVPSSDCSATRRFAFTLVTACPATVGNVSCQ